MLVDVEVEHHVHSVAIATEVIHMFGRKNIGLAKKNRVAFTPLDEFSHCVQIFKAPKMGLSGLLGFDEKRYGVYTKTRHGEFQPVAHDALNLGAHGEFFDIEIRLELIK